MYICYRYMLSPNLMSHCRCSSLLSSDNKCLTSYSSSDFSRYAPPIVTRNSHHVVPKLSHNCLQVVSKMSQSCPIVVANIVSKVAHELSHSGIGSGKGRVVYEGWRGAQIFGRQSQTWNSCSPGACGISIRRISILII